MTLQYLKVTQRLIFIYMYKLKNTHKSSYTCLSNIVKVSSDFHELKKVMGPTTYYNFAIGKK